MSDEIVVPLKWLGMAVSLEMYEDTKAREIVVDELKRKLPTGAKFHNIEWHTYLGEDFCNCFVTYYEVPNED